MNILVIGQCTLHWGRMEFGNIGNYYIIEPFFRELHQTFPNANIKTTFQMSKAFCKRENVEVVPMELYYGWKNDLEIAEEELKIANDYLATKTLSQTTGYIELVKKMDLVVDFSGDIWGDNADFLGKERFFVGLVKDRIAQVFANKTAMIAGSPGPFKESKYFELAKLVYSNFDIVSNREPISKQVLLEQGFDISKTHSLACPAFLFQPAKTDLLKDRCYVDNLLSKKRSSIGFLICGWNFTEGPYDKENRPDTDFNVFADAIENFITKEDVDIYLMSHSNGFPIPPKEFHLIHGRDYPIMKKLQLILEQRGISNNIYMLDEVYNAWETKAILGCFDMVVSGRVHAAVGAMSQSIPTVVIDYGHEPKAHKLKGFTQVAGQLEYLAQPAKNNDIYTKMVSAWQNRDSIRNQLDTKIPKVKNLARQNFMLLKNLFNDK